MITLLAMTALYFLPTLIASHRGHHVGGILVLNLLFGWTVVGWFLLLLWAISLRPYYCYAAPYPYGWRRY